MATNRAGKLSRCVRSASQWRFLRQRVITDRAATFGNVTARCAPLAPHINVVHFSWRDSRRRGGYMQTTAAVWPRCLLVAMLLSPTLCLAQSDTVPLVIGGHRGPRPDALALLLG